MRDPFHQSTRAALYLGDCVEVMAEMPEASIDAIVCDPPYGLEFMGKEWDKFRVDKAVTQRWRGERAGGQGKLSEKSDSAFGRVAYGGTRPKTSQCQKCGKRDAFRNPHPCGGDEVWAYEVIDKDAAPPSLLAFGEWCRLWAVQAIRILKPGGHLVAFGGTRTYHRLACALEDAGFEVRDCLMWLYGQGFPKSHDVSKAIDAHLGAEREKVRIPAAQVNNPKSVNSGHGIEGGDRPFMVEAQRVGYHDTPGPVPATDDGARWVGWGTGLKPAWEPIILARKPLAGTVAANVLAHGTGGLNVDGCRIGGGEVLGGGSGKLWSHYRDGTEERAAPKTNDGLGRWPANVVLSHAEGCELVGTKRVRCGGVGPDGAKGGYVGKDEGFLAGGMSQTRGAGYRGPDGMEEVDDWRCVPDCPVRLLDEQSGELTSGKPAVMRQGINTSAAFGAESRPPGTVMSGFGDSGGASRFFYTSKAGRADRDGSKHPTVKPLDLMAWLVTLVTSPGGRVLDPFAGSGTTVQAARDAGFDAVGIERDEGHIADAARRLRAEVLF